MRLESALNTSREGINAHGQAIAVVGDNIANSSTTAYKTARAEFGDILGEYAGDRNSEVVAGSGDGVAIKQVRVIQENGVVEFTGRELDVAIAGGGFFMVGDAAAPQFTRAGNFEINPAGLLVNAQGQPILGFTGAANANLGPLNMFNVETAGAVTTDVSLFGNASATAPITVAPQNPATYREIGAAQTFSVTQSVFDSLGARHEVLVAFFKTGPNAWTAQAYIDGGDVGGTAGTPQQIGTTNLTFGGDGKIAEANAAAAAITATPAYSNGAAAGNFTIDLSNMTQYAGGSLVNNVTQDGQANGAVKSYQFDSDGKVFAVLDNGSRAQIGSIPLATFNNVDGLERSGTGVFSSTVRAGDPVVAAAGSGLFGTLEGASLERSTVDIANQFVNLVLFQRGYQANSQVLSAANEMLQNTIGLLR
jgi:flagellar hook protein FlgE